MVNVKRYIIPDSLTESSGTITAIINGKSFQITPSYGSLTRNTRYQLYMIPGGTLEVSSLELSQAPVDRILIGSFYVNGLDSQGFGAFVNITGAPRTDWFNAGKTIVYDTAQAENGAVSTNPDRDKWLVKRNGKNLEYFFDYTTSSTTGASNGSSATYIFWPRNFTYTIDSNVLPLSVSFGQNSQAFGYVGEDNIAYPNNATEAFVSYFRPYGISFIVSGNVIDTGNLPLAGFSTNYILKARDVLPIAEFDETPIKDL